MCDWSEDLRNPHHEFGNVWIHFLMEKELPFAIVQNHAFEREGCLLTCENKPHCATWTFPQDTHNEPEERKKRVNAKIEGKAEKTLGRVRNVGWLTAPGFDHGLYVGGYQLPFEHFLISAIAEIFSAQRVEATIKETTLLLYGFE